MTARLNSAQPYALGLFRIVVGLLFLCHGAAKLFGVLGGADGQGGTVSAGTWPFWYSAVIELVGGTLVLLGLGTRAAAFIASGSMAYAYFKVHQPEALWPMENSGEAAAMFCWAFLLLIFTGSGAFGLDQLFAKRSKREQRASHQTPVTA
ncbi:DoxX family protein [Streptomyces sp. DG2A-72]|uniref:DoxX family protein n=1 Tax=Streptomyces sp. DG2A-72 TaxID=3051386 RepID=UPI00265BC88A|nr:DoxX family protein [Streptomyces sp. DG2A-72]MDO0932761.1 DoxX family protein [Streptomyces sp. DG2A-72]